MKEHIETVRRGIRACWSHSGYHTDACDGLQAAGLAALAKIEAEHERVAVELVDCQLESIPSRRHSNASWQRQNDALRARVEQLTTTLRELRCETLDMEPDAWGIRCIEDHNAIIDEALAAPEQKEPAQPPAPTWQPMETAPRNGKIILTFAVVDTDTGNWNMRLSWWRELRNDEGSHWMKWTEWCQPTHWMPMPAPPAASRIPEGE